MCKNYRSIIQKTYSIGTWNTATLSGTSFVGLTHFRNHSGRKILACNLGFLTTFLYAILDTDISIHVVSGIHLSSTLSYSTWFVHTRLPSLISTNEHVVNNFNYKNIKRINTKMCGTNEHCPTTNWLNFGKIWMKIGWEISNRSSCFAGLVFPLWQQQVCDKCSVAKRVDK
jgi:hypothetical protein